MRVVFLLLCCCLTASCRHPVAEVAPLVCSPGLANCDGDVENGCEVELSSDPRHCGACGQVCHGRCEDDMCKVAWQEVVVGERFGCALDQAGVVSCWGGNDAWELGRGARATWCEGAEVALGGVAVELKASKTWACARLEDGRVMCWGTPGGRGTLRERVLERPTEIGALHGVSQLAMAEGKVCGVAEDGIFCWGPGPGELMGRGKGWWRTKLTSPPVVVRGGELRVDENPVEVRSLSASEGALCAVVDARLRCEVQGDKRWKKGAPQPGAQWFWLDSAGNQYTDVEEIIAVDGGGWCARRGGGVMCWREEVDTITDSFLSWPVSGVEGVTRLLTGDGEVCGLREGQSPLCWRLGDASGAVFKRGHRVLVSMAWGEETRCRVDVGGRLECEGSGERGIYAEGWAALDEGGGRCEGLDSDEDGISDARDQCPDAAEVYNDVEDGDGCPDEGASRIVIDEAFEWVRWTTPVKFSTNKATLRPESYEQLNHLASALMHHERLSLVRIEGHTDDASRAGMRTGRLTRRRAEAVRAYLIERGVDPGKVISAGYGEDRPLYDPRGPDASKNRRIEVVIVPR